MSKYPLKVGVCKQCDKDIIAKNAGLNPVKRGRKFCSKHCQIIWQNINIPISDKRRKFLSDRAKKYGVAHMQTPEAILNLRKAASGSNHWNWQGGKTSLSMRIRNSFEYKVWRKAVFERDNYTCIWCGARSESGKKVILNADHIKPFALFPELVFDISNGRTLCLDCHINTPTFGIRSAFLTREDFLPVIHTIE